MLDSPEEMRLFGVRYRAIGVGLSVAAGVLLVLLVINVFQIRNFIPGPEVSREALQYLQGAHIRQIALNLLLGVIVAAGVLTIRHYYATRERLTQVRSTARAILDSLAGGVVTLDNEGRIGIINRAAVEMLDIAGRPPDIDITWLNERHPELCTVIRQAIEHGKYAQDYDLEFANSKGARLALRVNLSEQRDEEGDRTAVIVLIKNVTRLTAMEQQLRRRDRLAAAGTLAAGVAHEIRNPLSALELNISLMRDEVFSDNPSREELAGYFDILTAETRRLKQVTGNFLQLARPGPLVKTVIRIKEPLTQVLRLLEIEARDKSVSFETDLRDGDAVVFADPVKLEQLFLNILINAMQAMPNGGAIRIATRVGADEDSAYAEVSIADRGVGIPAENLPRLFDPYFTTREYGTGLGLAIADRIATDHGGRILVESEPGAGTTMAVRIPLASTEETKREPARA